MALADDLGQRNICIGYDYKRVVEDLKKEPVALTVQSSGRLQAGSLVLSLAILFMSIGISILKFIISLSAATGGWVAPIYTYTYILIKERVCLGHI